MSAERWTVEELETLYAVYSESTNAELKNKFPNRNVEAIRKKARKMGLEESAESEFKNRSASKLGSKCPTWKGGIRKTKSGYVQRLYKDHPRADSSGYVMEHILVWEQATGVIVPEGCCIHHLNGNKADNRIENLCMMTHGAHTAMHHLGTHKSEEAKAKISALAKERLSDKRNHPFFREVDMSKAVDLRASGMTVDSVCRELGICKSTYYSKMEDYKCSIE